MIAVPDLPPAIQYVLGREQASEDEPAVLRQ